MTHQDKGKFAKKHGPDSQPDPGLAKAVQERAQDGEIACAAVFTVAADRKMSPAEVGAAIDRLEISIVKCQLGFFGYGPGRSIVKPAASVAPELEGAIRNALVKGRLPCGAAWKIAENLGVFKMAVSSACERLGIRISACQLGAF